MTREHKWLHTLEDQDRLPSTTARRSAESTASARVFQVAVLTLPSSSISAQAKWMASARGPTAWSASNASEIQVRARGTSSRPTARIASSAEALAFDSTP